MNWLKQEQDNRRTFIDTLCELAENDKSIMLLICDTGFNYIEKFKNRFPNQFLNLGVTEPFSMIFAAGLSLVGRKVYIYSMIPFITFRTMEQIRNAVVKHNTSVKIIGVKGSSAYKMLGFSHNLLFDNEDEYHLKPYMACRFPKNNEEVRNFILWDYKVDKPVYMRI